MAISANSYGSVEEVAALTKRYTNAGTYDATTNPALTAVEIFIDRVSGVLNVILAQMGFVIPISQADAKLALDEFVVEQAADLCHAANGAGPFASGNQRLRGVFSQISTKAQEFLEQWANGFEALGAARTRGYLYGLQATTTGDDGETLQPPFDFDPDTEPLYGALVDADDT